MKISIFIPVLLFAGIFCISKTQDAQQAPENSWSTLPHELKQMVFTYVGADDAKIGLKQLNEIERVSSDFKKNVDKPNVILPTTQKLIKEHPSSALKHFVAASGSGDLSAVKNFLEAGVPINGLSPSTRESALMAASAQGKEDVVNLLLEHNADVSLTGLGNTTALLNAAKNGHTKIIEKLLEKKARLSTANAQGSTALMIAAANGHNDAVKYLISKGADVNARNIMRYSPLMLAAKNGHTDIVSQLIQHNADAQAKNRKSKTALILAQERGHTDIVRMLNAPGSPSNMDIPEQQVGSVPL